MFGSKARGFVKIRMRDTPSLTCRILPHDCSAQFLIRVGDHSCLSYGSGDIPHSNPTVGSMPFPFTSQGNNPFQIWTNPAMSGTRAGNKFLGQQGNVSYSSVNSFQSFSPFANAWNPYQGLSAPFIQLGSNFIGYRGFSAGVGKTPNFSGPQGSPFGSIGSTSYFRKPGAFQNLGHSFQTFGNPAHFGWNIQCPPQLPFLAMLNFPDLTKLMNDLIRYNPAWPLVPAKLPSDIPKFKWKNGEDPGDHVTTFHLCCSSNSLLDESIRQMLFQRILTENATKWYIEFPGGTFTSFIDLANIFLNHFQFPVRYEAETKLLANFHQDTATHISDHIQECR